MTDLTWHLGLSVDRGQPVALSWSCQALKGWGDQGYRFATPRAEDFIVLIHLTNNLPRSEPAAYYSDR